MLRSSVVAASLHGEPWSSWQTVKISELYFLNPTKLIFSQIKLSFLICRLSLEQLLHMQWVESLVVINFAQDFEQRWTWACGLILWKSVRTRTGLSKKCHHKTVGWIFLGCLRQIALQPVVIKTNWTTSIEESEQNWLGGDGDGKKCLNNSIVLIHLSIRNNMV